jgi:hypothetical protein
LEKQCRKKKKRNNNKKKEKDYKQMKLKQRVEAREEEKSKAATGITDSELPASQQQIPSVPKLGQEVSASSPFNLSPVNKILKQLSQEFSCVLIN